MLMPPWRRWQRVGGVRRAEMTRPRVLIFHSPGTNRDAETLRALELAGAEAEIVHVWDVRAGTVSLADCRAVVLPGGFGYGDALGAGVLQALDLTTWLQDAVGTFRGAGRTGARHLQRFPDACQVGLAGWWMRARQAGAPRRHPDPQRARAFRMPLGAYGTGSRLCSRLAAGTVHADFLPRGARRGPLS